MAKAVVFDLDGTLIDSAQCAIHATCEAFEQLKLPPPSRDEVVKNMGIPIERSFREMGARHLSESEFSSLLASFRAQYSLHAEHGLEVFDGIPDCLSALEKNDIAIAVATSKHSAVAAKNLQQLGISRFLPVVIGSDSVKEYKPNPEPLLTALNRLGIKPDASAIMVGDATVDIAMGHAAGVRTCAVTWGAHSLKDLQNSSPTFIARTVKAMTEYLLED